VSSVAPRLTPRHSRPSRATTARSDAPISRAFSWRQYYLTALHLIASKAGRGLAIRADNRRLPGDRNPEIRVMTRIDRFLKRNKTRALRIGAPNGEVPFCRRTKNMTYPRS